MTGSRLGIVISKRMVAHAVARNYCRRLMREVFRAEAKRLPGMDIVARPRTMIGRENAAAARAELGELMHLAYRRCAQIAPSSVVPRSHS